jgi:hypothetical protein
VRERIEDQGTEGGRDNRERRRIGRGGGGGEGENRRSGYRGRKGQQSITLQLTTLHYTALHSYNSTHHTTPFENLAQHKTSHTTQHTSVHHCKQSHSYNTQHSTRHHTMQYIPPHPTPPRHTTLNHSIYNTTQFTTHPTTPYNTLHTTCWASKGRGVQLVHRWGAGTGHRGQSPPHRLKVVYYNEREKRGEREEGGKGEGEEIEKGREEG